MEIKRAILIGAGEDRQLAELGRLADTMGIEEVGNLEQSRRDSHSYIGKGKREELAGLVESSGADGIVADDELTASQARSIEEECGVDVMDRAELIIRIFEAHAEDRASKMEVELAELQYRLPRIKGGSSYLSRLGGGVGTRGPGEQQLEYDRRLIRKRIQLIRGKLEKERTSRRTKNARLNSSPTPRVTLAGYTNAGKTTILNSLSGERKPVKDWLFETLDTTTRLVEGEKENGTNGRPDFVLTDTVGFIRKLPTQLIESFASTLEASREADIIVICADASSDTLDRELNTVRETLEGIGIDTSEAIVCLNKRDLLSKSQREVLEARYPEAVTISAATGADALKQEIYGRLRNSRHTMRLFIPHGEYASAAKLYGVAEIHDATPTNEGTIMEVTLPEEIAGSYMQYRIAS